MSDKWELTEIQAATRTFLWMLRSQESGFKVVKSRVRAALLAGPLANRNDSSVEFRFQNLSAVMQELGRQWVSGYLPAKNVGPTAKPLIESAIRDYEMGQKHAKRVSWLVSALPAETVARAARELAGGVDFDFDDSTTYDVVLHGGVLAPKAVIGYAALLHYGAPLRAVDFSGGLGTPCFERIKAAGFVIGMKAQPETDEFRKAVKKEKKKKFTAPPKGRENPPKSEVKTMSFSRLPEVVAWVEKRSKGVCELCDTAAPFLRPSGEPYLEVHHIEPLAEGGADTVENAAGLCPNCHRRCHHGEGSKGLRLELSERVVKRNMAYKLS